MLNVMIKKPKTIEDIIKKIDSVAVGTATAIEGLGTKMDGLAGRVDDVVGRMDGLAIGIDAKIDTSIGNLAIIVEQGFIDVNKTIEGLRNELSERITILEKEMRGMHGNFDMVFQQLREIRNEIKEVDTRADVVDLQIRISKLEKKVGN